MRAGHVETEWRWAVVVSGVGPGAGSEQQWFADHYRGQGLHQTRAQARAHLSRLKRAAPGLPARVVRVEVTVREVRS